MNSWLFSNWFVWHGPFYSDYSQIQLLHYFIIHLPFLAPPLPQPLYHLWGHLGMWSHADLLLVKTKSNNSKYFFWWIRSFRKVLVSFFPLLLVAPGFTAFLFWWGRYEFTNYWYPYNVSWSCCSLLSSGQLDLLPRLVPTKINWSCLDFYVCYAGTQLLGVCPGH